MNNHDLEASFGFLEKYHPELIERDNIVKDFIKTHTEEEVERELHFFK